VIQRVSRASVVVSTDVVGEIESGLLILLGVGPADTSAQTRWLAEKIAGLRIFADVDGKMNLSLLEVSGAALVVSQFTLYGNCRKGRRPSFVGAAHPDVAEPLYEEFCLVLSSLGLAVERGQFGADMKVSLCNDGPVTLVIDTP
jgi:D-tyrosyl-tRNA(Tyr) deacylase